MDCNRNNLSVISVSKGLQTADFPFFFFFLATQAPAGLRAAVRPAAALRGGGRRAPDADAVSESLAIGSTREGSTAWEKGGPPGSDRDLTQNI